MSAAETLQAVEPKQGMSRELAQEMGLLDVQRETAEFELDQRLSKAYAASGLFADVKGKSESEAIAACYVKASMGRALGIAPVAAMMDIAVVQGRPTIGAAIRGERMKSLGYDWRILQLDDNGCRLKIRYRGEELGEVSFTVDDAKRAGLAGKDNYRKNPKNMYFARAITNAQRFYAPEALGGMPALTEEEAQESPLEPHVEPLRAEISLADLAPSADENRGHDGAAASEASESSSDTANDDEGRSRSPEGVQTPEEPEAQPTKSGEPPAPQEPPQSKASPGSEPDSNPATDGNEPEQANSDPALPFKVTDSELRIIEPYAKHLKFDSALDLVAKWEGTKDDLLEAVKDYHGKTKQAPQFGQKPKGKGR